MTAFFTDVPSPVGTLRLTGDGTHLTALLFPKGRLGGGLLPPLPQEGPELRDEALAAEGGAQRDARPFREAIAQLGDYFAGRRREFTLPLAPAGTPFQRRVWGALQEIPYGRTVSYGELAARLGQPTASRAVGLANGRNPIAIVIPCHRVVGASGALTGYSGGVERKRWLLSLEASGATGGGG